MHRDNLKEGDCVQVTFEDEDEEVKQHDGIIADKFDDEETGIRWATVFFTDNEQRQVKLSQCYPTAQRPFSWLTGCFATVAADGMDIAIERAGQLCQVADSAATAMKRGLPKQKGWHKDDVNGRPSSGGNVEPRRRHPRRRVRRR